MRHSSPRAERAKRYWQATKGTRGALIGGPLVALVMLLTSSAIVAAQTPTRVPTPAIEVQKLQTLVFNNGPAGLSARATPDDVVTRLMSFDRDRDGKIAPSELPERMQPIVRRGDADSDGSLDAKEVRTLALSPTAPATARGFQPGGYGFADEGAVSSTSTRTHIDGALDDLGLPGTTRQDAGAIAAAFMDALEADAAADLMRDLATVLTPGQLNDVRASLDRPDQNRRVFITRQEGLATRMVIRGALEMTIEQFGLKAVEKKDALAAIDRYKARLRLGDADRSALLEPMKDLLNYEQSDNLRAALARRPLVKNGPMAVALGNVIDLRQPQPVPAILFK